MWNGLYTQSALFCSIFHMCEAKTSVICGIAETIFAVLSKMFNCKINYIWAILIHLCSWCSSFQTLTESSFGLKRFSVEN